MYASCVIVLTLLLTASGLDVVSAFSAAVASLNNTGPGWATVGPATTYANLTDIQTWICSFADAARTARAFYAAGRSHAGVLAQITPMPKAIHPG